MIERVRKAGYSDIEMIVNVVTQDENLGKRKLIGLRIIHDTDDLYDIKMFYAQGKKEIRQKVIVIRIEAGEEFKNSYVDVNIEKYSSYTIQFRHDEIMKGRSFVVLCFENYL